MKVILVDKRRREFIVTKEGDSFEIVAMSDDGRFTWSQLPLTTLHKLMGMNGEGPIYLSELPPPDLRPNGKLLPGEWVSLGNWRRMIEEERDRFREMAAKSEIILWIKPANSKRHTPLRVYAKKVNGNVL